MAVLQGSAKSVADGGFYPLEIAQSLRFNDNDSAYLSRTPSVSGNRKTWTWSGWVKRGNISIGSNIFLAGSSTSTISYLTLLSNDKIRFRADSGGTTYLEIDSNALLRDPSAWYHIVVAVDTTQAVKTNGLKLYINGVLETAKIDWYTQNVEAQINTANPHGIGGNPAIGSTVYSDQYLAEVHFVDGSQLSADDFGEFKSGVWVAKTPSVTYGTNGFYLKFANSGALGTDSSGNTNNWTPTNLAATDQMLDSPTNNFATFSPINKAPANALYQGNLYVGTTGSIDSNQSVRGTLGISSGKHYFEFICWNTYTTASQAGECGIVPADASKINRESQNTNAYSFGFGFNGSNFYQVVSASYTNLPLFASATSNVTVMSIAVDLDNGYMWLGRDGVWYNSGNPATGANPTISGIDTAKTYLPFATAYSSVNYIYPFANFGQDSSFAGTKTPQGNTDANGIGDFYYAPPTGYLALCTANLPEPSISPANDASPSDYFAPVIYTGNGSTQSIDVGFAADFVWHKVRSQAYAHGLYDSIRGAALKLSSNSTNAEATDVNGLTAFDANGFDIGSDAGINQSGQTYVAWNWLANGAPVSNTDGTITSTVSANVDSGFSIVSYTGTGSAGTVGHGLSSTPEMVIIKNRADSTNGEWIVGHKDLSSWGNYFLYLNTTAAQTYDVNSVWNGAAPTSSVVNLGFYNAVNGSSDAMIMYCFHSVEGYSKFGLYTGNGSTDGTFVYTGFRPAFVLIKRTSAAANWRILDTARDVYNPEQYELYPSLANAEGTFAALDGLSNGFKIRTTDSNYNASGGTYIFMAFAEMPAKYSLGR